MTETISLWEALLWGAVGGAVIEFLALKNAYRKSKRTYLPKRFTSNTNRVIIALSIFASGVLPVIYIRSGFQLAAIVAFSVGASMPAFVQSAASLTPEPDKGSTY